MFYNEASEVISTLFNGRINQSLKQRIPKIFQTSVVLNDGIILMIDTISGSETFDAINNC